MLNATRFCARSAARVPAGREQVAVSATTTSRTTPRRMQDGSTSYHTPAYAAAPWHVLMRADMCMGFGGGHRPQLTRAAGGTLKEVAGWASEEHRHAWVEEPRGIQVVFPC